MPTCPIRLQTLKNLRIVKRENDIKNSNFIIDTPQKSYLLGLLWGDGSLYNTKNKSQQMFIYIGIVSDDFKDIEFLFDEWYVRSRLRKNRTREITEARYHDTNFSDFLFKNDYSIKSLASPSKILQHIPDNLCNYFWRGLSDADGCFYARTKNDRYPVCQYALAGSYEQDWTDFESILKKLEIKYTIKRSSDSRGNKGSVVRFCSKDSFIKFGTFIYQGESFGLKRKYDKFISVTR